MLLITGTQRTGTSLMSSYCKSLGYDMGTDFWHKEINGGLESPDICEYYSKELNDPTFPFIDFRESVKRKSFKNLSELTYDVQKFSFLLMNPKFVDIWVRERNNKDKMLILMRNMEDVCKSKEATLERSLRFGGDSKWLKQSPNQLKINWYDSLIKLKNNNVPIYFLKFPNYLTNYDDVFNALKTFGGLNIKYNPKSWNNIIDLKKITIK